jgi:hypothetical protein
MSDVISQDNEAPDQIPGTDMLLAWEEKHFGKNPIRIHDRIERGSGSAFRKLPDAVQAEYAALEKLIGLEDAHGKTRKVLTAAQSAEASASAAVQRTREEVARAQAAAVN